MKKKPTIEKKFDAKFAKFLGQYVKHQKLELELTLKNGQTVIIGEHRSMKNGMIIQHFDGGEDLRVSIGDIAKADIYAV